MAGPAGVKRNVVFWRFTARHGHSELPQENHLSAEWRGKVTVGRKLSFLTVLAPLPDGTTLPPNDLERSVEGGRASVRRGTFSYVFPTEKQNQYPRNSVASQTLDRQRVPSY
jgi:hypothetical protein